MKMANIQNIEINRNIGTVNIGNHYNLTSLSVSKTSNGSGAFNKGVYVNGRRNVDDRTSFVPITNEPLLDDQHTLIEKMRRKADLYDGSH